MYTATLSTPTNIQAAFKKCGIYLFGSTAISDSTIALSLSFVGAFSPVAPAENQTYSTSDKTSNTTNNNIITDLIRFPNITTTASTGSATSGVLVVEKF